MLTVSDGAGPAVPAGPALSIFDPVFIGIDEHGRTVCVPIIYRNLLAGGEPGAGKSGLLNLIVGHGAMDPTCDLVLMDAKLVELGQWEACAREFVGADQDHAIRTLERLQALINRRNQYLRAAGRRKVVRADEVRPVLVVLDEIAYYSATVGDKKAQERFSVLLRDVVARGRSLGVMVVAATQRPSSDIIPTSLRDLFAWRAAFRCTTDASSDIVLGHGWHGKGWSANTISPSNPGCGLLIAEGGTPGLFKAAYLSDADCARIASYAATMRAAVRSDQPLVMPSSGGASTVRDAA